MTQARDDNQVGSKIVAIYVKPHEFEPLRWWDRLTLFGTGRCKRCMANASPHWDMVNWGYWAKARPHGDKDPAERGCLRNRAKAAENQPTEASIERKET